MTPIAGERPKRTLRDWIAIAVMLSSAPSLALIFTATGPVLPLIAKHFTAGGTHAIPILWWQIDGPFYAQLIATMPSVGLMLGGGPTGFFVDRLGVRRVLVGALAAFTLFGSAGFYIDDPIVLLASRLALGFAAVAFASATITLIGQWFGSAERARILSYRNILGGLFGVGSTFLAGDLAKIGGYQAVFALFLAPLILIPLALYAIDPIAPRKDRPLIAAAPRESVMFLWPIYALAIVLSVVMMMNTAQLSFLLNNNGITDPVAMSHVIGIGSLMAMVGSVLYAYAGPKLGVRGNYTLIAVLLGGGATAVGLSHDSIVAGIGAGLSGLGAGCLGPHFSRLVLDRAPESARGRAVGLNFSAIYFGDFINPFVVRPFTLAFGIHNAFIIIGTTLMLSALQIVVPRRMAERRAA